MLYFRTDCDILYKSENLASSEVKTTLAEQNVGAENIHKEDAEGEHYQGGEGALSQVIYHFTFLSCSAFLLKHLLLYLDCSGMISGAGQ